MYPSHRAKKHHLTIAQALVKSRALQVYRSVLARLFQDHRDTPEIGRLSAFFRAKDYQSLVDHADFLSKQQYGEATQHFVVNQFVALIKKYPWPADLYKADRRGRAKQLFLASEHKCSRVNKKFRLFRTLRSPHEAELQRMRSFVSYVLGTVDLGAILDKCDFGPGASIGTHGNATSSLSKLSGDWTVSAGAMLYAYNAINKDDHLRLGCFSSPRGEWLSYDDPESALQRYYGKLRITKHNKISFVPKTAKVDRTIAVEPLLNGYVQKGIDTFLRQKLLRIGIDLTDQTRNMRMAREGSTCDSPDSFVTIDLSSASDSVSIELCRTVLPPEWFELLDNTRSKYYSLDGRITRYEKFCSMGNGFCFPIETLLFCAMAAAAGCGVPGTDFSVYGDDIIIRQKHAADLLKILRICGFSLNADKTFLQGPFRESCGSDWFGGNDVRPFTLDFALDTIQNIFKFLNLSQRNARTSAFLSSVRPILWDALPKEYRFVRPFAGPSDTCVTSVNDEHLMSDHCVYRRGSWHWKALRPRPRLDVEALARSVSIHIERVMLRGGAAIAHGRFMYYPEVTLRRETQTEVTRESYMSTSNWLPSSCPASVARDDR